MKIVLLFIIKSRRIKVTVAENISIKLQKNEEKPRIKTKKKFNFFHIISNVN